MLFLLLEVELFFCFSLLLLSFQGDYFLAFFYGVAYFLTDAFRDFCDTHPQMHIYLVVLDKESFDYCKRQQAAIPERVDEHSAQEVLASAPYSAS